MNSESYIARIVECYQTGNGNYFCREENKQELDHHLDWEIFIPEQVGKQIKNFPIYGIIFREQNPQFFNGNSRLTCRTVHSDRNILLNLLNQDSIIDEKIEEDIELYKTQLEKYYIKSRECEIALKKLKLTSSIQNWLNETEGLFITLNSKPDELRGLKNQFQNIEKFLNLYAGLNDL